MFKEEHTKPRHTHLLGYSTTNNNFYKVITWRSPFEDKTVYKICVHSIITKLHERL